jgi:hypothetical protein
MHCHQDEEPCGLAGMRNVPHARGVQKRIAEILAQIHGDAQLESAGLNGQLGDQCRR